MKLLTVQLTAVEWAIVKGYRAACAGHWTAYDQSVRRTIEYAGFVVAGESIERIARRYKRVTPGDVQSAIAAVPQILSEYRRRPPSSYPELVLSVMEFWNGK